MVLENPLIQPVRRLLGRARGYARHVLIDRFPVVLFSCQIDQSGAYRQVKLSEVFQKFV